MQGGDCDNRLKTLERVFSPRACVGLPQGTRKRALGTHVDGDQPRVEAGGAVGDGRPEVQGDVEPMLAAGRARGGPRARARRYRGCCASHAPTCSASLFGGKTG